MSGTRLASVAAAVLLTVAVVGCTPVQLRTQPAPISACMDALATGRLVADARTGLGIADATGQVMPVEWPFGYSARREPTGLVLLDNTGQTERVVAREGDVVQVGGGIGAGDIWFACGGVKVVPPA